MTKKGNLFFLIKSLTKAEKRYFTTFCFTQNVSKNYIRLYEAILKQERYDETAIRKKFRGEAFLRQLHVAKNYLGQLILKSLRNYHSKISKEAQVKDILRNVEILFSRELYDLSHYELIRAEKIAREFEMLTALIEVLKWKRRLALTGSGPHQDSINELLEEENTAIEKLSHINEYWKLTNNIFKYADDKKERLLKEPVIRDEQTASTLAAKTLRHHVLYSYFIINNRADEAYPQLTTLAGHLESFPRRIHNDPGSYTTVLNNQVGFLIRTKEYDKVISLFEKIKAIPEKYQLRSESKFSVKLWLRTYNIELEMYRDQKDFEKGIRLITEIEAFLEGHQKSVPPQYYLMLWYQFANIYFMSGHLSESLQYVNRIINTRFEGGRIDLEKYTRFLNLMIHFELDNIIVLRYAIEACRRFLRKMKKTAPFEKVLLSFFSKICNAPRDEYPFLFTKLKTDLFDVQPPLINDYILDYLDFRAWIEKKLT